jgi:hypothetical protein
LVLCWFWFGLHVVSTGSSPGNTHQTKTKHKHIKNQTVSIACRLGLCAALTLAQPDKLMEMKR